MPDITPASMDALFFAFNARFQAGFNTQAIEDFYREIATEVTSGTEAELYYWLETIPGMKEWLGERTFRGLNRRAYRLPNKDYQDGVKLERNKILDNQLRDAGAAIQSLGVAARLWPNDLTREALLKGHVNACWNGHPFFHTAHPVDMDDPTKGTYSNLLLTNAAGDPMDVNPNNLMYARNVMHKFVGIDGRPLQCSPTLLVHGPDLEAAVTATLKATTIAPLTAVAGVNVAGQAQQNIIPLLSGGPIRPLMLRSLAGAGNKWWLIDTTKPLLPFLFQLRQAVQFTALDQPTAENVFFRKTFLYGADGRGNYGYTTPWLAMEMRGTP